MRRGKRLFSFLLTLLMCLSLLPMGVLADGEAEEPAAAVETAEPAETEGSTETEEPAEAEEPAAEESVEIEEPAGEGPAEAAEPEEETPSEAEEPIITEASDEWEQTGEEAANAEITASGACGDNLTWTLDGDGVLTISGTGEMENYGTNYPEEIPWYDHRESITSVVIESGVTSIGGHAFYCCDSLTSVTIPNSVTSIGDYAFSGTGLTEVIIPDSVTEIGESVFQGCESLTSVTISNSLTSIECYAFAWCYDLTSVTIPDGVTRIGEGAFWRCVSLRSLTIPDSVTTVEGAAFDGTPWLADQGDFLIINHFLVEYLGEGGDVTIPDGVTSIKYGAFAESESKSEITSVTIPDSVTSIESQAFRSCTGLTSVTIPDSVTSIGDCAFSGCTGLESVTFMGDAPEIGSYGAFSDWFPGYDLTATAYYYEDTDGWTEEVRAAFRGNITWVSLGKKYLASADGNAAAANADGTAWESGVTLTAAVKTDEGLTDAVKTANKIGNYTTYSLALTKDGAAKPADGNYTVTLAAPEGYDGAKCAVYQAASDGTLTAVDAVYADGVFSFTSGGLGTYVVAMAASQYKPGDVNGDGSVGAGTGGPTGDDAEQSAGTAKTSPKTGDETNIALWAALFVLCAAGAVIAAKKPRRN